MFLNFYLNYTLMATITIDILISIENRKYFGGGSPCISHSIYISIRAIVGMYAVYCGTLLWRASALGRYFRWNTLLLLSTCYDFVYQYCLSRRGVFDPIGSIQNISFSRHTYVRTYVRTLFQFVKNLSWIFYVHSISKGKSF